MKKFLGKLFALSAMVFVSCRSLPPQVPQLQIATTLAGPERIDKYGGLHFGITAGAFFTNGFALADTVVVALAGNEIAMPVVSDFRQVEPGRFALVAAPDPARPLYATIFYGDAASGLGIAHKLTTNGGNLQVWQPSAGLSFPLPVVIRLVERGCAATVPVELVRSNERADYPHLTDAAFANFRGVRAPAIAPGILYRSSSPIDPSLGRSAFADAAAKAVGVRSVVNMADTADIARAHTGWRGSHVSECATLHRPLGVDVSAADFAAGLADICRFIATNAPPCLLHCKEGKDRTGFVCAVLELLQGATLDEAAADYQETFRNYYGHQPDSSDGVRIREAFRSLVCRVFRLKALDDIDLQGAAGSYLLQAGLSAGELALLRARLSAAPCETEEGNR